MALEILPILLIYFKGDYNLARLGDFNPLAKPSPQAKDLRPPNPHPNALCIN